MIGVPGLSGLGALGLGLGGDQVATLFGRSGSSSNPNLLTSPDAFDNAIWVKTFAVVTPNVGDPTYPTADQVVFSGGGSGILSQTSSTAAATGAGVINNFAMTSSWQVASITGTFNSLPYTLTAEFREPSGAGNDLAMQIIRSGGFIKATIFDLSGGDPTFLLHFAKLEQSASFSGYP